MGTRQAISETSRNDPGNENVCRNQKKQSNGDGSIWNVHKREFLYDTAEEYETAFPPAKRRKIINDDDDDQPTLAAPQVQVSEPEPVLPEQSQGDELAMRDICEALDEISNQIEKREQEHRRNNQAIRDSLTSISSHEHQIAMLLTTVHDATAQIETHRQAIAKEMATIEASFAATSSAIAAPTLGPLTHAANSSFDPDNYQCRECSQLFDPRNGGFWLIGPNCETGDTFYLCRECTRFMEETTTMPITPMTSMSAVPTTIAITSPHQSLGDADNCCNGGDCDCWDSEDDYYSDSDSDGDGDYNEPRQGDYDHSEECS